MSETLAIARQLRSDINDLRGKVPPRLVENAEDACRELERLHCLINSPETNDFMRAVPLEAAHQIERWGAEHDERKSAWDWFWTLGYLGGKAANAMLTGDLVKAKHHCITLAALGLNWHRRIRSIECAVDGMRDS